MLVVIEGDNGTGKDTLAKRLNECLKERACDSCIITYEDEVRKMEKQAKEMVGLERICAFFRYNEFCGNISKTNGRGISLLVRYWPSTVAASYADDVFPLSEIKKKIKQYNVGNMPAPDIVFCLCCDMQERKERILKRMEEIGDASDDLSIKRNKKYRVILSKIEKFVKNWHNIDVTFKTEEEVFNEAYEILTRKMNGKEL